MEASAIITGIITPSIALVPTLMLVWKSWEKKRISPPVRLIRKKGRIEKVKLRQKSEKDRMETRHKAEMDRELLELDILKREVKHEAELKKFEVGLERQEEKEILETTNPLTKLKQQGQNFAEEKIGQAKDKVSQFKDKWTKKDNQKDQE